METLEKKDVISASDEIKTAVDESSKYFSSPYSEYIFYQFYSRWVHELGRRETWIETINRYMDYMRENMGEKITEKEYSEVREAILKQDICPSMRLLWSSGKACKQSNVWAYNCSYIAPTKPQDLGEIMYVSMCGAGLGFAVEWDNVQKFPQIEKQIKVPKSEIPTHVVIDSKEGWADAFVLAMKTWYDGKDIKFDYSSIRPAGSRLETAGGKASGPQPLMDLMDFTKRKMLSKQGRRLSNLDLHDIICQIGLIVVAGGVRRSALISLSELDDMEMRDAKQGQFYLNEPQRSMANNSVVYSQKPTAEEFLNEWTSLVKSKSGERGIFNRGGLEKQVPVRRWEAIKNEKQMGLNPCFHPDTIIETTEGRKKIKDITKPIKVYTMQDDGSLGVRQATASWKTKTNTKVVKIKISTGKELIVTPDHQIFIQNKGWVAANELKKGDVVVHLARVRRGAKYIGLKLTSEPYNSYRMEHRFIWENTKGQIKDGFDIHHKDGNTHNNTLSNFELINHSKHATLTRHECDNDHQIQDNKGRFISGPDSKKGKKEILDLPEELKAGLVNQFPTIVSVKDFGTSDVYDISVEGTYNVIANYIVAHNCGEIYLRSRQFCNLTSIVIRPDDTVTTLRKKMELATLLGTYQSTLTNFGYLSKKWKDNCDEERLLGVSLTGYYDNTTIRNDRVLDLLRTDSIEVNKKYAERFGINQSTAITCVKPHGNSGQLLGVGSGMHPWFAPYFIRRVRINHTDSLLKMARDQGVPCVPEVGQNENNASTYVLEFPVKAPEGAIFKDEVSALDLMKEWKRLKEHFVEHNPSATIYVGPDEWLAVGNFVYENWDIVGGMSFLPRSDHVYQLAPYQEITKAEYEKRSKAIGKIDFSKLSEYENTDNTTGAKEAACVSGVCDA